MGLGCPSRTAPPCECSRLSVPCWHPPSPRRRLRGHPLKLLCPSPALAPTTSAFPAPRRSGQMPASPAEAVSGGPRPGAVCALWALVFPGLGAGSGLRAPCAPGRQVWPAHGHVSSRGPGGIWTCLLLGALPFTTWPGYLPESVGMGRDRAVQRGGRPADCGLLGDSGPGRAPDPAAVRPQAAVIPLGWDPAPPTSHVTWRRSRARPVSPGLLAPSLPCCTCAGVLTVTPRRRAKGARARTAG